MSSLLGKLKEGMDQVVSGAQDKIHEAQIRAQIRTIEKEKADQLTALGSAVYAMHQAGGIRTETLTAQIQAVVETDQKMAEKERELEDYLTTQTSGVPQSGPPVGSTVDRRCECGATLSPAARFCPSCGKPNPVEAV